jgi:CDP-diacylglycerol--glycerol-3-phosphate 3-phosphatidyltransferase
MDSKLKLQFVTFLTVVRFPLVLLFFAGAVLHSEYPRSWLFGITFACLIASAVTDLFDGFFARKFQVETKFGAHADPLMDKFFYLCTMPLLVFVAAKNAYLPHPRPGAHGHAIFLLVLTILFLARDQWVTFLRSIGAIYNVSGKANWSGKVRTCLNFPLICSIYHYEESPFQFIPLGLLIAFEIIALAINLLSLAIYTRHYWPFVCKAIQPDRKAETKDGAANAIDPASGTG